MNGDLVLAGAIAVRIIRLDQRLVYAGVIEGVPNRRINQGLVADELRRAAALCPGARCHLIPPSEKTPYPTKPNAVFLPSVVCNAVLERIGRTPNDHSCWETLVVVWFQDEFALPIAAPVLDQLQALDWRALAVQTEM